MSNRHRKAVNETKTNYFVASLKLPSLNEYVKACRANKYVGAKFKKNIENMLAYDIYKGIADKTLYPVLETELDIYIEYHEKTKRRDVDNIQSSQKFILDALQKTEIITNDNRRYIKNIYHTIVNDTKDYAVVHLYSAGSLEIKRKEEEENV